MSLHDDAPWAAFPLVPELVASLVKSPQGLAWTKPRLMALEQEASALASDKLFEAMRGLLRLGAALEETGEARAVQQLTPILDRLAVLMERRPRGVAKPARLDDDATSPNRLPLAAATPREPMPRIRPGRG